MKRALMLALVLALGACETVKVATQPVDMTSIAKGAYEAKLGYQALLVVAVAYAKQPRCGQPTSPKLCSDVEVLRALRKASDTADAATQAAENAVRNLGDQPTVAAAAVKAAQETVGAMKKITEVYKITGADS